MNHIPIHIIHSLNSLRALIAALRILHASETYQKKSKQFVFLLHASGKQACGLA